MGNRQWVGRAHTEAPATDARHLLTFPGEHPKQAKHGYIICRCGNQTVFGATPNTARETRALPGFHKALTNPSGGLSYTEPCLSESE